jgi:hypothetical protein
MEIQPHLYDVSVQQLNKLDSFVGNPAGLERALGVKLDGTTDDDRFRLAARALFGREVDQTLDMLHEGQPGFLYVQTRKKIDAAMRVAREVKPREKAPDDFDHVLLPTEGLNGSASAEQPQQLL